MKTKQSLTYIGTQLLFWKHESLQNNRSIAIIKASIGTGCSEWSHREDLSPRYKTLDTQIKLRSWRILGWIRHCEFSKSALKCYNMQFLKQEFHFLKTGKLSIPVPSVFLNFINWIQIHLLLAIHNMESIKFAVFHFFTSSGNGDDVINRRVNPALDYSHKSKAWVSV